MRLLLPPAVLRGGCQGQLHPRRDPQPRDCLSVAPDARRCSPQALRRQSASSCQEDGRECYYIQACLSCSSRGALQSRQTDSIRHAFCDSFKAPHSFNSCYTHAFHHPSKACHTLTSTHSPSSTHTSTPSNTHEGNHADSANRGGADGGGGGQRGVRHLPRGLQRAGRHAGLLRPLQHRRAPGLLRHQGGARGRLGLLRVRPRSAPEPGALLHLQAARRRDAPHARGLLHPPHLRLLHARAVAEPQRPRGARGGHRAHLPRARTARVLPLRTAGRRLRAVQLAQLLRVLPPVLRAEGGVPADKRREERRVHVPELLPGPHGEEAEEDGAARLRGRHAEEEAQDAQEEGEGEGDGRQHPRHGAAEVGAGAGGHA